MGLNFGAASSSSAALLEIGDDSGVLLIQLEWRTRITRPDAGKELPDEAPIPATQHDTQGRREKPEPVLHALELDDRGRVAVEGLGLFHHPNGIRLRRLTA